MFAVILFSNCGLAVTVCELLLDMTFHLNHHHHCLQLWLCFALSSWGCAVSLAQSTYTHGLPIDFISISNPIKHLVLWLFHRRYLCSLSRRSCPSKWPTCLTLCAQRMLTRLVKLVTVKHDLYRIKYNVIWECHNFPLSFFGLTSATLPNGAVLNWSTTPSTKGTLLP